MKRYLWYAVGFVLGFVFCVWAMAPIVAEFIGGMR